MGNRKGQSIVEYAVILIVILGALIVTKDYIKRGVQGKWKQATDQLSDQYDPQYINSNINYATQVNSISIITTNNVIGGQWTNRVDTSNSLETKTGYSQVGE